MAAQDEQETILGNGLTSTQKWIWVVGLTLAAYWVLYKVNKK